MATKTKAELETAIDNTIYTNAAGEITAADHNALLKDMNDSYALEADNSGYWNGFDLQDPDSNGTIWWSSLTRTFSIEVKSGESEYHFWVNGGKVTKTSTESVIIPDTTGTYYIYFDNDGNLQYVELASVTNSVFYEYAIVGIVYWNATYGRAFVGNERHGIRMSSATHQYNHDTYGARYESGMDPSGLTAGNSTYTSTGSGYFWDEDIRHTVSNQSTHYFLYREGSDGAWKTYSAADNKVGILQSGDTYYSWNENTGSTWQLTEGTSSTDFWILFFVATPSIDGHTVYKLMGQNAYSSRSAARDAIYTEIRNISTDGLPSPEFVFLYAAIVKRDGTVVALDDGSDYLDLRYTKGAGSSANVPASVSEAVEINGTYTLKNEDNGKTLYVTGGYIISLPTGLNDYIGCRIVRDGTSNVTLSAASGATLNTNGGATELTAQYAYADIHHKGSGVWYGFLHNTV